MCSYKVCAVGINTWVAMTTIPGGLYVVTRPVNERNIFSKPSTTSSSITSASAVKPMTRRCNRYEVHYLAGELEEEIVVVDAFDPQCAIQAAVEALQTREFIVNKGTTSLAVQTSRGTLGNVL